MLTQKVILTLSWSWAYANLNCLPKTDNLGLNYLGTQQTTQSGRLCQRWDVDYPNRVKTYIKNDRDHNYCRNPDNDASGPWCYLSDYDPKFDASNWQSCGIPTCRDLSKIKNEIIFADQNCVGTDSRKYRGITSTTKSGHTCQGWLRKDWTTHRPSFSVLKKYPKNPRPNHNFCRNYADDGDAQPWCYTTNPEVRWEECEIRKCDEDENQNGIDDNSNHNRPDQGNNGYIPPDVVVKTTQRSPITKEQEIRPTRPPTQPPTEPETEPPTTVPTTQPTTPVRTPESNGAFNPARCEASKNLPQLTKRDFKSGRSELQCGKPCECTDKKCYLGDPNACASRALGLRMTPGLFPFQAHIRSDLNKICDATILNKDYLLISAECIHDFVVPDSRSGLSLMKNTSPVLYAAIGFNSISESSNISAEDIFYGKHFTRISEIQIHPCFDISEVTNQLYVHNLALVKLSNPIIYGVTRSSVQNKTNYYKTWSKPICIAANDGVLQDPDSHMYTFTGQNSVEVFNSCEHIEDDYLVPVLYKKGSNRKSLQYVQFGISNYDCQITSISRHLDWIGSITRDIQLV